MVLVNEKVQPRGRFPCFVFCTIFVYPLTFLVGPKVFSGKTSLLNSVQWSGRAHVGQIPETKPYSYQTLLLADAEFNIVSISFVFFLVSKLCFLSFSMQNHAESFGIFIKKLVWDHLFFKYSVCNSFSSKIVFITSR